MRVLVSVILGVRPRHARRLEHNLDRALNDTARREERLGRLLQTIRAPAHHDDFEAALVVEVDVHRRPDLMAEIVLHARQTLGELADVMVIDEGDAGERFDALAREGANDFSARKIPKEL